MRGALDLGQRGVQVSQRGLRDLERRPELGNGGREAVLLGGEDREEAVEVRDQVLQLLLVGAERGHDLVEARDQLREVVRLGAEQRFVDRGRALQRIGGIGDRVVQRLGRRLPVHGGILIGVLLGTRRAHEAVAETLQEDLERLAIVCLQRGQDLVELHRRRGPRDRDRVAARPSLGELGRARVQLDEEVALEEDARADLGVASSWIGRPSSSISSVTLTSVRALRALDADDLADVRRRRSARASRGAGCSKSGRRHGTRTGHATEATS